MNFPMNSLCKEKHMKKIISMIMMLAFVLAMLGGCSSKKGSAEPESNNNENESTKDNQPATADSAKDPVYIDADAATMTGEVRFLTAFAGNLGTDALIEEFNKYYPNIKVTYETYGNTVDGNLGANTSIQAGNADVILSYHTHNTAFRWENGMLMDLTDYLKNDNLDLVKEWGTDAYLYQDRVYALPSGGVSIFIALNMDKWNAADLGEIPESWTWDEYLEACRAMTEVDSTGKTTVYGGADFNQRDYWTYPMRQTKGVDAFYNEEGLADFDSGLAATILNRFLAAEDEGIWYPKINFITDGTKTRDLVWSGTIASCVESIITRFVMDKENYPHDFILGYAPYPTNEEGETNYAQGAMINSFFCVTNNAQNPDAAYAFAKFASTYGGKYMYRAGHTTTWTGTDPDEIINVVFGSEETAAEYVDVDSYITNVIAIGQPAYHEEYIVGYNNVAVLVDEYTDYIFSRTMTVEEGLKKLNELANEAIEEAK